MVSRENETSLFVPLFRCSKCCYVLHNQIMTLTWGAHRNCSLLVRNWPKSVACCYRGTTSLKIDTGARKCWNFYESFLLKSEKTLATRESPTNRWFGPPNVARRVWEESARLPRTRQEFLSFTVVLWEKRLDGKLKNKNMTLRWIPKLSAPCCCVLLRNKGAPFLFYEEQYKDLRLFARNSPGVCWKKWKYIFEKWKFQISKSHFE